MTKSTITRERLEKIKSWRETYGARSNVMLPAEEAEELACMALDAMESEADCKERKLFCSTDTARMKKVISVSAGTGDAPLYRHAQQPVVPDDVLDALQKVARLRLDLNDFDGDRRGIADCLCEAEEALIEVVNRRAAMLHAGSYPAQSDCYPAQNSVNPEQSPIDHGYRPECECSGCKATARICAELSANSPANPDCWCCTCRPVTLNDMRFVVCPDCGNKRCPRANDHRNACTGSNEPGQEGSAFPDSPQEAKP
ncbi:TPA: hypothetical protein ACWXCP_002999 [Klebsiella pneumoniae]